MLPKSRDGGNKSPGTTLLSGETPTDYWPMVDFDLRTLSRKILLIVAILSCLAIAEMVLVAGEEPAQQVSLLTAASN